MGQVGNEEHVDNESGENHNYGYEDPGDPVKMARAMIACTEMVVAPSRLALGRDYEHIPRP